MPCGHVCKRGERVGGHGRRAIDHGGTVVAYGVGGRLQCQRGVDLLELVHLEGGGEGAVGANGAKIAGNHAAHSGAGIAAAVGDIGGVTGQAEHDLGIEGLGTCGVGEGVDVQVTGFHCGSATGGQGEDRGDVGETAGRSNGAKWCGDDHVHRASRVGRRGAVDLRVRNDRADASRAAKLDGGGAREAVTHNGHRCAAAGRAGIGRDAGDRLRDVGEAARRGGRAAGGGHNHVDRAGRVRRAGACDLCGRVDRTGGSRAAKGDSSTGQVRAGDDHARAASRRAGVGCNAADGRGGYVGEAANRGGLAARRSYNHIHRARRVRRAGAGDLRGRVDRTGGSRAAEGDGAAGQVRAGDDHARAASLRAGVGSNAADGWGIHVSEAARRGGWATGRGDDHIHRAGRVRRGGAGGREAVKRNDAACGCAAKGEGAAGEVRAGDDHGRAASHWTSVWSDVGDGRGGSGGVSPSVGLDAVQQAGGGVEQEAAEGVNVTVRASREDELNRFGDDLTGGHGEASLQIGSGGVTRRIVDVGFQVEGAVCQRLDYHIDIEGDGAAHVREAGHGDAVDAAGRANAAIHHNLPPVHNHVPAGEARIQRINLDVDEVIAFHQQACRDCEGRGVPGAVGSRKEAKAGAIQEDFILLALFLVHIESADGEEGIGGGQAAHRHADVEFDGFECKIVPCLHIHVAIGNAGVGVVLVVDGGEVGAGQGMAGGHLEDQTGQQDQHYGQRKESRAGFHYNLLLKMVE